ncbi:hypothetical protein FHX44_113875 [Pseudonocardia hierapolitana]|uniref:Transmembrane protein n=1 Tax=Pseudonocardia hierapolitana TaxID=1128676 RepID=A0A561SSW5_9PSEU|nr:hypothetical protein [Pseudonocardia hierapolitana]TWF77958.1 hypothetical protein FHX44_113875 [Pseudonocardia hierapolitana]
MRFYAERPARAGLQLLGDLLVAGWIWLTVAVARAVHDFVLGMQGPARTLAGAGESIRGAFDAAARTASNVPFVGDDLARALGAGTGAGDSLVSAGREQMEAIARVAFGTTVATVLLGAMPVLLMWLPLRVRYARLARSAVAARAVDSDLLALRAITRRPVRSLLRIAPDPAASWRRDERAVVHRLAALELHSLGLRSPRTPPD